MAALQTQVAQQVAQIALSASKAQAVNSLKLLDGALQIAGLISASGNATLPGVGGTVDVFA